MAEYTFEGEVGDVSPSQLELISNVLQKIGVKDNKVQIARLGKPGDNYAANVKQITAILNNGETFEMIAKVAPTNEMARLQLCTTLQFQNECLMYEKILPKFVELQNAAGLSQEFFYRFPKCYGTLMEPFNEIILLEDLKKSNFEMLDRLTPLTNESVKQILKNFAALHSLSFVMKKQTPDQFDLYIGKFQDVVAIMSTNPQFQDAIASLEKDMISVIDNEKYKEVIRGSISKLTENISEVLKYENNTRYSVVIHSDAWTNNIMFRLQDDVPVEAVLVDYQRAKISNPVCDLLLMIFTCTDYTTRHQHYYEWMNYYYSEFDKSLDNFGLKASDVYPRAQLDDDLRKYSKLYFNMAILVSTFLLRKTEDAAKLMEALQNNVELKDLPVVMNSSNLDPEYVVLFKKKIEDLVDSYTELGYLS